MDLLKSEAISLEIISELMMVFNEVSIIIQPSIVRKYSQGYVERILSSLQDTIIKNPKEVPQLAEMLLKKNGLASVKLVE